MELGMAGKFATISIATIIDPVYFSGRWVVFSSFSTPITPQLAVSSVRRQRRRRLYLRHHPFRVGCSKLKLTCKR
jgi:hypothetical protein